MKRARCLATAVLVAILVGVGLNRDTHGQSAVFDENQAPQAIDGSGTKGLPTRLQWLPTQQNPPVVYPDDGPAHAISQAEPIEGVPPNAARIPVAAAEPIIEGVRFADSPLQEAMRLFSQQAGLNVLVSPEAAGIRVTFDLRNATPSAVLDTLARNYRLVVSRDESSGVIHLYTVKEYQEMVSRPGYRACLQSLLRTLEREINQAFPASSVSLSLVGEQVLVQGQAKDALEVSHIMKTVVQSIPPPSKDTRPNNVNLSINQGRLPPVGDEWRLSGPASDVLDSFGPESAPNVVNLLHVPGEQQVMLCVTVAEVNRTAARSIGLNFSFLNDNKPPVFQNVTGGLLNGGPANLTAMLDNGQVSLAINALRQLSLARSLAEPNLTTLNGQCASFNAGGQFPVPVVAASAGGGVQGVGYVPFGVQLQFTPYIVSGNHIRLTVQAKVSTRDPSLGSTIGGSNVPGLTSRDFQGTVELLDGQTLAVAGLIQTNYGATADRIPLWGDLPLFGRTGAFDRVSAGEQELVILITPCLVHPLERNELPPLPGHDIFEPNDIEFYLCGKLESNHCCDFRSSARTDWCRLQRRHTCRDPYLIGPSGYSYGACEAAVPGRQ